MDTSYCYYTNTSKFLPGLRQQQTQPSSMSSNTERQFKFSTAAQRTALCLYLYQNLVFCLLAHETPL